MSCHIREGRRMPWKSWAGRLVRRRCSREPSRRPPQIVLPQTWSWGRGYGQPPRRTIAGPGRWGVSKRTISLRGQAKQRGAHKLMANVELLDHGFEPGQPGALEDRRHLMLVKSSTIAVPPFHSAHCFRVSPDPGDSWNSAMRSGRRHR